MDVTVALPPALTLALLLATTPLAAQAGHDAADHAAHQAPYAGMDGREIKALSPEETEGLLQGEGLGFALAAELNGLPGPLHVLEMADELALRLRQRRAVEEIHAGMRARARELGARIVEEERHLDRMFARGHATPAGVRERTAALAALRGELRATHLVAHLETRAALDPDQVERYARLRGYAPGP